MPFGMGGGNGSMLLAGLLWNAVVVAGLAPTPLVPINGYIKADEAIMGGSIV